MSYLNNSLKGLMTLLISPRLLKVSPDADIFPQENLAVLLQPVQDLLDVLLEEPESQPLVELDLLGVPLWLQLPVVGEDLVDDGQDVTGALLIVSRWIWWLRRRSGLLEREDYYCSLLSDKFGNVHTKLKQSEENSTYFSFMWTARTLITWNKTKIKN